MSIHESSLIPSQRLQAVKVKGDVSLQAIQEALTNKAEEYGVPLSVQTEEVKKSGLFNKASTPCLEYYHPGHSEDYFRHVMTSQKQGLYTYFEFFYYGSSPNHKLMNKRDGNMSSGSFIAGAIRGAIANSKQDQIEEENNWYSTMDDIIIELMHGE